jgi:uncharacterized protein (DUF433 family)
MIDWTNCPDVESVPGRCGGAWVIKGTRIMVECILDNAEDCTAEEIAGPDIYPELDVDVVRRVLAFASPTPADPETIYIEPICDRCKNLEANGLWSEEEQEAACMEEDCPNKPRAYIRADLFRARLQQMEDNAVDFNEARELHIAILTALLKRARGELDAFGHAELIDEINEALPNRRC